MKREIRTLALGTMMGVGLLLASACVVAQDGPRHPRRDSRQTVVVYQYEYYPSAEVYYHPQRHTYYWLDSGRWRSGRSVPTRIHINERPVAVELNGDRPYFQHETVKAKHPPGKAKGHDDKGQGHDRRDNDNGNDHRSD